VLNRAWRGDACGALALVAGGGDTYDDPLELLADVAAALGLPLPADNAVRDRPSEAERDARRGGPSRER
jgi:hypothetical protein